MHWISGSGLPDIQPFLLSGIIRFLLDATKMLPINVLFCSLSDFTVFQIFTFSPSKYSTHIVSLSLLGVHVWWFVFMCMQSNFVLFVYKLFSQHSDTKFGEMIHKLYSTTLSGSSRISHLLSGTIQFKADTKQEVKVIWQKAASSPQRSMPEVLWQKRK